MRCKHPFREAWGGTCASITPVAPARASLFILLLLLLAAPCPASAQRPPLREESGSRARLAVSQNLADYLFLGTLNAELQYAVRRNWTLGGGTRYNNWTWRRGRDDQFESRRKTFYVGARWWPWYSYSGWWAGGRLQYQEYNQGGLDGPETEEGDAVGFSLGGGYAVQVNSWLNVDFGLYGWGGMTRYVTYACPHCGQRTDAGTKAFFLPDELRVAVQFIF